jgi:hypothetical protein
MTSVAAELELEHENEFELEQGPQQEQEAFFNHLSAMADRGGRSQALRRIALRAAREALRGASTPVPAIEGESEASQEFELELEFDPGRRANLDAMLEHLAHAASEAESEQEAAEQFLPLIPLAAKFALPLLGKALPFATKGLAKAAPRILGRVVPHLTRGVGRLTRSLFRGRGTRPLLRALPRIARNTVSSLALQVANGRKLTPRQAALTLARQTARVLGSPRAAAHACRKSIAKDRIYHRRSRRLLGIPAARGAAPRPRICPCCGR